MMKSHNGNLNILEELLNEVQKQHRTKNYFINTANVKKFRADKGQWAATVMVSKQRIDITITKRKVFELTHSCLCYDKMLNAIYTENYNINKMGEMLRELRVLDSMGVI